MCHKNDSRLYYSPALLKYAEAHSGEPNALLFELERETFLKTLAPQMLSGRLQGQFLRIISMIARPSRILEIGTFTGYSALCLAAGLPPDGQLHTIEVNDELEWLIRKYFNRSEYADAITLHIGDATEIIPHLAEPFDLIFIDAGKHDYIRHYELALAKANPGALILADNVLWSGKVVDEKPDADTRLVMTFNNHVQNDHRVENVLLPVRDGLMMVRKK